MAILVEGLTFTDSRGRKHHRGKAFPITSKTEEAYFRKQGRFVVDVRKAPEEKTEEQGNKARSRSEVRSKQAQKAASPQTASTPVQQPEAVLEPKAAPTDSDLEVEIDASLGREKLEEIAASLGVDAKAYKQVEFLAGALKAKQKELAGDFDEDEDPDDGLPPLEESFDDESGPSEDPVAE